MKVERNTRALDALAKIIAEAPKAKLGVLGSKNSRSDGGIGNAEIGLVHEFGGGHNPARSWLRMPIIEHMQRYVDERIDKEAMERILKEALAEKSFAPFVKKLGLLGEEIIQEAFATGGFGKWKPSNMARKKVHQTLVETQQLRNSVSSEVIE